MLKKTILTAIILTFGTSFAYAAGSDINANIQQKSTISNSKVIGASDLEVDFGEIPFVSKVVKGGISGEMSVNTIENTKGKLEGQIIQTNNMDSAVVVASEINKLVNDGGTVQQGSVINQDSTINDNSVVVGASVNKIKNSKK
ncbi:hypothetical protein [Mailhella sp.]